MIKRLLLIILASSLLAACSATGKKDEGATVEQRNIPGATDEAAASSSAQAYGTGFDAATNMLALDDPQSPLSVRIIYFDYDSSTVLPQFRNAIEAHAAFLVANPNVIMSMEGHADERGSREYNLALGERRAITVKRQMLLLGASASQTRTISYGEERPVEEGHDEYIWSQNRRVELIY